MAALLCVASPWSVPIGPIPITLATFMVYLTGVLLGSVDGTIAVAVYLLLGTVGVPVFSGFSGGFQKLAGVTGGYLVGYLPCALLSGIGAEWAEKRNRSWILPVMMAAGTAVLYLIGTLWFMIQTGNGLGAAMSLCVLPFLPGDGAKILAATLLTVPLRKAVLRFG